MSTRSFIGDYSSSKKKSDQQSRNLMSNGLYNKIGNDDNQNKSSP